MRRHPIVPVLFAAVVLLLALQLVPSHAQTVVLMQSVTPQVDVWTLNGQTDYTLTAAPVIGRGSLPMVFVNGLLMASGHDYTLSGRTLHFTGQPVGDMGAGTIVQVLYWTVAQ